MDDCRCVVTGVAASARRVIENGGTQFVVGVQVGLSDTFIDHVGGAHRCAFPLNVHAYLDKYGDDTGVLTDGAMSFSAQSGINENLCHGIFGGL